MSANLKLRSIVRSLFYNDLPLGGTRLALMNLSTVFSSVAGGLCVKMWTQHHHFQKLLDQHLPPGVSAVLEYRDVRTTSIIFFAANQLLTMAVSHILIIMLQDIYKFIPSSILRRMRLPQGPVPISTVTLPLQAAAMLFSTVCLIVAGSFHAAFVFSRSGTVSVHQGSIEVPASTIQGTLDQLGLALLYRDVQYIRVSGELVLPALVFAVAANAVTLAAWYKCRRVPAPILTDSVADRAGSSEGGEGSKDEKDEKDAVLVRPV
ncbi:hypothetical protein GGX14DRAFT_559504 [Mycena pura]|uniref:Uncharacterized protein n=1 Tax=Mycena pura TaxID=153505 RepID=A0AAD6VV51_9AGAR|nr:hypothetical protein GGX14DRAFT_559504 [Mycena pura]